MLHTLFDINLYMYPPIGYTHFLLSLIERSYIYIYHVDTDKSRFKTNKVYYEEDNSSFIYRYVITIPIW